MKTKKGFGKPGKSRGQAGVKLANFKAKNKSKGVKSRKDKRKELRQAKKQRQHQHALNKGRGHVSAEQVSPSPARRETPAETKRQGILKEAKAPGSTKSGKVTKSEVPNQKKKGRKGDGPTPSVRAEKSRLDFEMQQQRVKQLRLANRDEDKNIRRLAKQLKLNRRKSKSIPKAFASEGLDYLLEVCDSEKLQALSKDQLLQESSGSEFEDDFAEVTGKKSKADPQELSENLESDVEDQGDDDHDSDGQEEEEDFSDFSDVEGQGDEESSSEESEASEEEERSGKMVRFQADPSGTRGKKLKVQAEISEQDSDLEDSHDDGEAGPDDDPSNDSETDAGSADINPEGSSSDDEKVTQEYWEDIYGRQRDKAGNVVQAPTPGRYVPPALRDKGSVSDSVRLTRLRRQMQGLLNRVAESNMAGVSSELEGVVASQSRGEASQVLGELLHAALAPPHALTPTKMAAEHAMLLAILHAHVGSEMGATFLQNTVTKFHKLYQDCEHSDDKTVNNLLLILCFMYAFKIFHCTLLFDLLKLMGERFAEKDVELILLVLKTVGLSLRKDDPAMLKDVIVQLQRQASSKAQPKESTRVGFMMDTLLAIKNNNMARIPDHDPELVPHLRKVLRGLLRPGADIAELRISLQDLLHADERGRWWVVGSAWQGSGPGTSAASEDASQQTQAFSQQVLELARKQRMNTDVRKNIFCILMTAEDHLDAFEKLLRLGLKGQQEREIPYVLLDCCLQEKAFNPYYSHLAQRLCDFDRRYRMSVQCSVWDKVREATSLTPQQLRNLASFTAQLVLEGGLTLAVLKVVDFSDLQKATVKLVRQVLLGLLLTENPRTCGDAFARLPASPSLALLRESLRLFLQRYILRAKRGGEEQDSQLLATRVGVADRLLSAADSKVTL